MNDPLLESAWAIDRMIARNYALLEACKTVLPYIEAGESGPNGFTVVFPPDVDPFIVARAVAKAEGGGA